MAGPRKIQHWWQRTITAVRLARGEYANREIVRRSGAHRCALSRRLIGGSVHNPPHRAATPRRKATVLKKAVRKAEYLSQQNRALRNCHGSFRRGEAGPHPCSQESRRS